MLHPWIHGPMVSTSIRVQLGRGKTTALIIIFIIFLFLYAMQADIPVL